MKMFVTLELDCLILCCSYGVENCCCFNLQVHQKSAKDERSLFEGTNSSKKKNKKKKESKPDDKVDDVSDKANKKKTTSTHGPVTRYFTFFSRKKFVFVCNLSI